MKHCWVAIDVDCIPISKAYIGQLIQDTCKSIKESLSFQVHKKTKTVRYQLMAIGWGHAAGAGSGTAHHYVPVQSEI